MKFPGKDRFFQVRAVSFREGGSWVVISFRFVLELFTLKMLGIYIPISMSILFNWVVQPPMRLVVFDCCFPFLGLGLHLKSDE